MDNLITLQNLKKKLPPWNPNSENQLFAIVDMGRYVSLLIPYYRCLI